MGPFAKKEPKKPTPGSASVYNHILQYTTQNNMHLRNRPEISRPRPKQTVLAAAGIRRIPLSPDPALLPSPPLLGVSRVTAVQIHPTISCSVRAGSTRQTVPRNRPPWCGFTQQSKRDRSATWWPGDIHNRPSVHDGSVSPRYSPRRVTVRQTRPNANYGTTPFQRIAVRRYNNYSTTHIGIPTYILLDHIPAKGSGIMHSIVLCAVSPLIFSKRGDLSLADR